MSCRVRAPFIVFLVGLIVSATKVHAQTQSIANMQDIRWTVHDSAPRGIDAIAMSPAGLLYLATFSDIFQFDGKTFDRVLTPGVRFTSTTSGLYFTRQGDLIIMFHHGAPVLLSHGIARLLDRTDGPEIQELSSVQQTPSGRIWALLNMKQLINLGDDGVWHKAPDPGGGRGNITRLFADPKGALWIVVNDRLFRKTSAGSFEQTNVHVYGDGTLIPGIHSDLWIPSLGKGNPAQPIRHLQHIDHLGNLLGARDIAEALLAASVAADGSLWLLTEHGLVAHLPSGLLERKGPRFSVERWKDRKSLRVSLRDATHYSFLEAQDGSIWVGGLGGIERLHESMLDPLFPYAALGEWDNCFERNGSEWVVDPKGLLYLRSSDGRLRSKTVEAAVLQCSPFGNVLESGAELSILSEKGLVPLSRLPLRSGPRDNYVWSGATRTSDGAIVAVAETAISGGALWKYVHRHWVRLDAGPSRSQITALYATHTDTVYVGFQDGTVALLEAGSNHVRPIGMSALNGVIGFTMTEEGLFAYGNDGIAVLRDHSFTRLQFADPDVATMVSGLAQSTDGALWLNGKRGIARFTHRELSASLLHPLHLLLSSIFSEGPYSGPAVPRPFGQSVQVDPAGRLWFNTLGGIVAVALDRANPSSALPFIFKDVLADGVAIPSTRKLPAGLNTLSIRYAAIDFVNAQSLSYRYKLEGYDDAWQDAGQRTEAVYTHLHAGTYSFQVQVKNSFGVWSSPYTLQPFIVVPHFYERSAFWLLAALISGGLVWGKFRQRLTMKEADIRRRTEARADERVNIARDLHDTLLQGVHGLLLTFHAAAEEVPADHSSRPALELALTRAEKLILEGRDRVKGLRGTDVSGAELGPLFEAVAKDLNCTDRFRLRVLPAKDGTVLRDYIAAELFLIGRECIVNAARHSHASCINLFLEFGAQTLFFECSDDGIGFDAASPKFLKQGRWGISGMRERTDKMSGSFSVRSRSGQGTLIRVSVPGKFAYVR